MMLDRSYKIDHIYHMSYLQTPSFWEENFEISSNSLLASMKYMFCLN